MANFDVDDPRYRITPSQQMWASCFGALVTSTLGRLRNLICDDWCHLFVNEVLLFFIVTPLDVVKIRLQAQQNTMPSKRCFIYCNGLMDHCIICVNGNGKSFAGALQINKVNKEMWYKRPGHFNGTLVNIHLSDLTSHYNLWNINLF